MVLPRYRTTSVSPRPAVGTPLAPHAPERGAAPATVAPSTPPLPALTEVHGCAIATARASAKEAPTAIIHTVSGDMRLSKGFAPQVVRAFGRPPVASAATPSVVWQVTSTPDLAVGHAVDKRRAPQRPTLAALARAVEVAFHEAAARGIRRIIMPRIGCGLDLLQWSQVRLVVRDAASRAGIPVTVAVVDPAVSLLPDLPLLPRPSPNGRSSFDQLRFAAVCSGARVTSEVGDCPVCRRQSGDATDPPPSASPPFDRMSTAATLLRINPGCGGDDCDMCGLWRTAVREVVDSSPCTTRANVVACLVRVHSIARGRGFAGHQKATTADKTEDGSLTPAPDSPELLRELSAAQQELDQHRVMPAHPITPDTTKFNRNSIVSDAAGLARATSSRVPPTRDCTDLLTHDDFIAVLGGVASDLATGSLSVASDGDSLALSHPFVVWQNGKPRVCVNFKPVNEFMTRSTTTLPRARDLALAGRHRSWLVKLDLKTAFRRVRVPAGLSPALAFAFGGVRFRYDSLPFGWSHSPEVFAATLAPAVARAIEAAGPHVSVIVYVDDIAIAARTPEAAVAAASAVMRALRAGGFVVSAAKTFLRPVKVLRFLGLLVRAGPRPGIGIAPSTVSKARAAAADVTTHGCRAALATVWGLTAFAAYSAAPELTLSRAELDAPVADYLNNRYAPHFAPGSDDASAAALLAGSVVDDLAKAQAEGLRDVLPTNPRARIVVTSDASASGGAAHIAFGSGHPPALIRRPWSIHEATLPSTVRELLMLLEAFQYLATTSPRTLAHVEVVWVSDSSSAVSSLNTWHAGAACVRAAVRAIRDIAALHDATIVASWCPREDPSLAAVDARSRFTSLSASPWFSPVTPTDESLSRAHASLPSPVTLHFAPPFGRPLMAARYASNWPAVARTHPKPHPRRVAALETFEWAGEHVWASPPRAAVDRLMAALSRASALGPWAALTIARPESFVHVPLLSRAEPWRIATAVVAEIGAPILRWDTASGKWERTPARERWVATTYAGCPAAPVLGDRVPSSAELTSLLHASGFPPHPGPRTPAPTTWADAARHDHLSHRRPQHRSVAQAFTAERTPTTRALAPGPRPAAPPGPRQPSHRTAPLPAPPHPAAALCIRAAETGAASVPSPPSIGELLSALAAEDPDEATMIAARVGALPRDPSLQQLRAQMACAIVEIDAGVGPASHARAARAAAGLLGLARVLGVENTPASGATLDAIATAWARARLRRPAALELDATYRATSAPSVYADMGAVGARLRRRFPTPVFHNPPSTGLGPTTTALLLALGGSARHDSSPKRIVWGWEVRWGLQHHLDVVAQHPTAVAAICAIGGSMWRSIYVRHLRRCDAAFMRSSPMVRSYGPPRPSSSDSVLTSWDKALAEPSARPSGPHPPVAIRWSRAHKTNRFAGVGDLPSTDRFGFIAAPWVLDVIHHFIPTTPTSDTAYVFSDDNGQPLSYNYIARVLRLLLSGLPDAASATPHGLRLGIDAELRHLGVPDIIRDLMGWWKRVLRRMGELYEAEDAARVILGNSLYGTTIAESLAPGLMASSADFRGEAPSHRIADLMPAHHRHPESAGAAAAGAHPRAPGGDSTHSNAAPRGVGGVRAPTTRTCGKCGRVGHIASNRLCPFFGRPNPHISSSPGDDGSESDDSDGSDTDSRPVPPPPLTIPPESVPAFVPPREVGGALLLASARASVSAALARAAGRPGHDAPVSEASLDDLRAAAIAAVSVRPPPV